jgi:RNA polymerase sigma-70 factor (ECF subfamily)
LHLGPDGSLSVVDTPGVHAGTVAEDRAAAFRRLLDGSLDDAYRRAAVVLANRIEAEDAVHDAAERAWRSWGSLRDTQQFEAWFARILLNVCRDRLRSRRRVAVVEVRGEPPETEDVASTAAFRGVDDRARVLDALADLSADERIAIVLRYEADLTVPEIARLIGAREGTIKARLHRALGRLRVRLGEEERA